MQFARRLGSISRRLFASSAASNKKKGSTTTSKGGSNSQNQGSKQMTHDISKMPQPHPVLTPINRRDILSESFPSLDKISSISSVVNTLAASTTFKIDLETELQQRLPKSVSEVTTHFGGNYSILRTELLKSILNSFEKNKKIVLDGPNGSGKSVTLMQLFSSYRESIKNDQDKLCLYAPNCHKWTSGYFAYYPTDSSTFIQPELALEILELLTICNKGKGAIEGLTGAIKEARLDAYDRALPLYQKTIATFLSKGIELTMFLDGVNGLIDEESLTLYLDREGNKLPLKSLPLCSQLFSNNCKIIGAMTRSLTTLPSNPINPNSPIELVNVPNYHSDDLKSVLQLYSQLGHCSTNKSDQFVAFKAFVSGGNGRKLFKSCEFDSIYNK